MMITIVMLVEIWDSEHGKERVNRSIWSNCGILGLGLDRVACGGDGEGGGGCGGECECEEGGCWFWQSVGIAERCVIW